MPKELRRNPRTGKLEEVSAAALQEERRIEAEERRRGQEALRRQENLDRLVMKKSAADKLYPTMRKR